MNSSPCLTLPTYFERCLSPLLNRMLNLRTYCPSPIFSTLETTSMAKCSFVSPLTICLRFILYGYCVIRVRFEHTHINRPVSSKEVRRFSQTFRSTPSSRFQCSSLFGALGHYVILMQYTPQKPCCQAIFRILAQYFCQARDFMARTGACKLCTFWLLIFEFCTFSPKTPLCILYTLALDAPAPLLMQKAPQLPAVPLHAHSSR